MTHVASEMQRLGMNLPLLIGGATTSRAHTAVKIAPSYEHPVIHVLDASRSVGVVNSLLNPDQKPGVRRENAHRLPALREEHAGKRARPAKRCSTLEARARQDDRRLDWAATRIDTPAFLGRRVIDDQPLDELGAVHRLVAVLPHVGIARSVIPASSTTRTWASRRGSLYDDARRAAGPGHRRTALAPGAGGTTGFIPPTASATTSNSIPSEDAPRRC